MNPLIPPAIAVIVFLLSMLFYMGCFRIKYSTKVGGCPRGVRFKVTDCGIVVSEFVL